MCTVTLIPTKGNDFILTSNRDEAIDRNTLLPEFYKVNNRKMLFPKDAVAGGTWIGVSDQNTMICLLNGGFEIHKRLGNYRLSRGVVVKDFLEADDVYNTMHNYDYTGIEPFTIVAASWKSAIQFYELVWDGVEKHIKVLGSKTYIWSSSTLYTEEMKQKRRDWFRVYQDKETVTPETLINFHKNAGIGDKNVDLQIDRGMLKTKSITQIVKVDEKVSMRYEELLQGDVHNVVYESVTV